MFLKYLQEGKEEEISDAEVGQVGCQHCEDETESVEKGLIYIQSSGVGVFYEAGELGESGDGGRSEKLRN